MSRGVSAGWPPCVGVGLSATAGLRIVACSSVLPSPVGSSNVASSAASPPVILAPQDTRFSMSGA